MNKDEHSGPNARWRRSLFINIIKAAKKQHPIRRYPLGQAIEGHFGKPTREMTEEELEDVYYWILSKPPSIKAYALVDEAFRKAAMGEL